MAPSRKVRQMWTLFNIVMTAMLLPMMLMTWKDSSFSSSCSVGRIQHYPTPIDLSRQVSKERTWKSEEDKNDEERRMERGEDDEEEQKEEQEEQEEQKEEQNEKEDVERERGGEGKVVCPPPGSGTFSAVRLKSTALASYQGSGNTWVRHLLTTATGILTGTAYPNETREVPAGNHISRAYRLLVIKTHMNPKESRRNFPVDRCILVVRNPYEAILSEFNRGGVNPDDILDDKRHIAVRQPKDFQTKWPKYVETQMSMWLKFNWYWAKDHGPLHVIAYHRLVENTGPELRKALSYLNESSIHPTIHCATRSPEGWAHRQKPQWQQDAAVFNRTQVMFLNLAIDRVQKALELKTGDSFGDFRRWKR